MPACQVLLALWVVQGAAVGKLFRGQAVLVGGETKRFRYVRLESGDETTSYNVAPRVAQLHADYASIVDVTTHDHNVMAGATKGRQ